MGHAKEQSQLDKLTLLKSSKFKAMPTLTTKNYWSNRSWLKCTAVTPTSIST